MPRTKNRPNRRDFLYRSALLASGLSLAGCAGYSNYSTRRVSPNEKLNLGIVGAGGRGADNLKEVSSENIVAICDVSDINAAKAASLHPKATVYRDFRKMLDAEKSLDGVVVSTPDHMHATIAIAAMRMGRNVYCEKPLARTIWEARQMSQVARDTGLATQMGTQGHAMEGTRRAVEVIRSGVLGEIRELHVWTDRPSGWWPQGVGSPTDTPAVPANLDWDLWLGSAPPQPYSPAYVPFKWRGFYAFGTGAIGDMGVHNLDTAFWALELGLPTSAAVKATSGGTRVSPPEWSIIELQFPARGSRPPVKLTFYDGKKMPPAELFQGEPMPTNGSLVVGAKGTLFTRTWHGGENADDMFVLLPRKTFADYTPPPHTLPRATEHHAEWIQACKGGPRAESNFIYAATLTEALLVGLLAVRTGRRIEWDTAGMRARGVPEAGALIRPEFRKGWSI